MEIISKKITDMLRVTGGGCLGGVAKGGLSKGVMFPPEGRAGAWGEASLLKRQEERFHQGRSKVRFRARRRAAVGGTARRRGCREHSGYREKGSSTG